jgi:SAM-dependent methyltransferase
VTDHHRSLRAIASRVPASAWGPGCVDLPWGDPEFSERMLREHLDQAHDLASRRVAIIEGQVERLVGWLGLGPGSSLLDVTCGPGLVAAAFARRGVAVAGVDIAPAAIRHAREITAGLPCTFIESDVRAMSLPEAAFDAAVYLYGQPQVPRPGELDEILRRIRAALRPGAPIAVEVYLASPDRTTPSTSWSIERDDLFGPGERLVLAEHALDAAVPALVDRYHVLDMATGRLQVFGVTERLLEPDELAAIVARAGFPAVDLHPGWDGLGFDGAEGWVVAIGR